MATVQIVCQRVNSFSMEIFITFFWYHQGNEFNSRVYAKTKLPLRESLYCLTFKMNLDELPWRLSLCNWWAVNKKSIQLSEFCFPTFYGLSVIFRCSVHKHKWQHVKAQRLHKILDVTRLVANESTKVFFSSSLAVTDEPNRQAFQLYSNYTTAYVKAKVMTSRWTIGRF